MKREKNNLLSNNERKKAERKQQQQQHQHRENEIVGMYKYEREKMEMTNGKR